MRTDRYSETPQVKKAKPVRRLLTVILVLAAAVAGAGGYSYSQYKTTLDSLAVVFTDDAPEVEIGEDYQSMDFVSESVGELTVDEEYLDTDTVGEKEIVYTVSQPMFGGIVTPSKDFSLSYTVVDNDPPLVLWSGNGTVLELGTEFDINKVIAYGDNADPVPAVTVEGEVDMETEGEYPLHVTVTDASGNSTDWELYVEVAENLPVYDPEPEEGTPFEDFIAANAADGTAFGIDVSSWQGDIDFEAVKAAGCDFVMIRIGYSDEGNVTIDNTFEQNYERAKAAGLKVGLYLYSYDNTEEKVRVSADWIIEKLGGDSLDLPIAFDWEDFGNFQSYEMSFNDLNNMYDAFSEELGNAGYDCILYGSLTYLERVWTDTDTRPVWLAHYTDETDYEGPYIMWQASCTGKIDGIEGLVDMNVMY